MASTENSSFATRVAFSSEASNELTSPISGYENSPIVDINTAIRPLVSIVSDVEQMLEHARYNTPVVTAKLNLDEEIAIRLYTQAWSSKEKAFHNILNAELRLGKQERLKPWFLYMQLLITGVKKLDRQKMCVFRGVKLDIAGNYKIGNEYVWWQFTSCTSSSMVLEQEDFLGKTGERTMFQIECTSGRNISKYSSIEKEEEILLLPGFHFQVLGKLDLGNSLGMVHIKEIPEKSSPSVHKSNEKLKKAIEKCKPPKLALSMADVKDCDMHIVIGKLVSERSYKQLDLTYNEIAHNGLTILSTALKNDEWLEELILAHNQCSDVGVQNLASVLNSTSLKRLDLTQNEITDEGARYLVEMLKTNTTLIQLSLSHNEITDDVFRAFLDVLIERNATLELFNLSANKNITDQYVYLLKELMARNITLKRLDLRACSIPSDVRIMISEEQKTSRKLKLWL